MKKILKVEGMMCDHCASHVAQALEKTEGVSSAKVCLKKKTAVVKLTADVLDEVLIAAVKEAGYEAEIA